MDDEPYRALRRHLDGLPVGYPGSAPGMRILRKLFDPREARIALGMDWRARTTADIAEALRSRGIDPGETTALEDALRTMAGKGSILWRKDAGTWALMPFVVGMFELQAARLDEDLYRDTVAFLKEGFGLELLASGEAQTRIIPIGAAIRPEHRVADYEEFRSIIRDAGGRIAVLDCICRRGKDLVGEPCKATARRELCIVFRDYADTVTREGWGRAVSVDEALAIADANERDGLVMRPSNERHPQFLCACCGDCCGLLSVAKAMRRPADFIASGFRAVVSAGCVGCSACVRKCPMEALTMSGGAESRAAVAEGRCIGCGVCVAACPKRAISLVRKEGVREPPSGTEELLERLAANKPGTFRKLSVGLKGILGIPLAARRTPWRRQEVRVGLRPARPEELEALADLHRAAFRGENARYGVDDGPESETAVRLAATMASDDVYVILERDTLAGCAIVRRTGPGEARLRRIVVDPRRQRKGLGRTAIRALFERYGDVRAWTLDTPADNEGNRRFYRSLGFEECGTRSLGGRLELVEFRRDS